MRSFCKHVLQPDSDTMFPDTHSFIATSTAHDRKVGSLGERVNFSNV